MPAPLPTMDELEAPPGRLARFSVEQYHRMIASGAIAEDERIELLDGWLVQKVTKNPRHSVVTRAFDKRIAKELPAGWHVRNQEPITLASSEPEPDLAIVRGSDEQYEARHPGPVEVALVIEVAESSLMDDRLKARIYAAAGIPEYWIINLPENQVEIFSLLTPNARSYGRPIVLSADAGLRLHLDQDIPLSFTLRNVL